MKVWKTSRRLLVMGGAAAFLAGCQVIPKAPGPTTTSPDPLPTPTPTQTGLPQDETRHRIALLVPMSGSNGAVGQSIANAATMALLDTNADNLRITTYDTSTDARGAARRAVSDGNRLILGPLMSRNVGQVLAEARPANVPLITFSNDFEVAAPDVFVVGHIPEQSIERTVAYARRRGSANFAAIVPEGEYGRRAEAAFRTAVANNAGTLTDVERFSRSNTSIVSAAQRLQRAGGFDTVLIADGVRLAVLAAGELRPRGTGTTQLLGTELWSGEAAVTRSTVLRGAWFSAVSDQRYKRYADSYQNRFNTQPYRISTLGYDSVLMTLRMARDWQIGSSFPKGLMYNAEGFIGIDGAFRFDRRGVIERAWEVREVRDGLVATINDAPTGFVSAEN